MKTIFQLGGKGVLVGIVLTVITLAPGAVFKDPNILMLPCVGIAAAGDAVARFFIPNASGWTLIPFLFGTNMLVGLLLGLMIGGLRVGGITGETQSAHGMKKHKKIWLFVIVIAVLTLLGFSSISFRYAQHRWQTNACVSNQRHIDSWKQEWAMVGAVTNGPVNMPGILWYAKGHKMPICPGGGTYIVGALGEDPRCSIHGTYLDRHYPKWWE